MRISRRPLDLFCVALILAAGGILGLTAVEWLHDSPELGRIRGLPGVGERLADELGTDVTGDDVRKPPVVVQAETFARYLTPPRPPTPVVSAPRSRAIPVPPAVRPVAALPHFRLRATCCYVSNRKASRALVWEPGDDGKRLRWVKEGDRLAHFVVQEIRSGMVVCLNGQQQHEVRIERTPGRTGLVKRHESVSPHAGPMPPTASLTAEANVAHKDGQ